MLKQLNIGQKLGIVFILSLIIAVITTATIMYRLVNQSIMEAAHIELHQLKKGLLAKIESEAQRAESQADLIANIPDIQEAMANKNRPRLQELLEATFKRQKSTYAIRQFQFHLPPATSFLRVHKLQKYGDDLSGFRKTVVQTNRAVKPIRGLEKGVAGLGIRGVVPVKYQNKHIGSVEFGISLGQKFVDTFVANRNFNIGLFMHAGSSMKLLGSTYGQEPLLTQQEHQSVLDGQDYMKHLDFNGVSSIVLASPIKDFSGNIIGVVELIHEHATHEQMLSNARNTAIGITLVLILIALGIIVYLARSISNPIHNTISAMVKIANGDLTVKINENDSLEARQLTQGLNQLSDNLQKIVHEVSDANISLQQASEDLSKATELTSQELERENQDTEKVAISLKEMGVSVDEVASSAANAAQASQSADSKASEGNGIVKRGVKSIRQLAGEIDVSAKAIKDLQTQTYEIGDILEVIRTIADQTNLLALNAAIEAARAGEAGRGFAVVADEVRTLAVRTQEATEQIQKMIESLQNGASNAVSSMDKSQTQVGQSVEEIEKAGVTLNEITEAIRTINEMNRQIASSTEAQKVVTDEINQNIARISDATNHTVDEANHVMESSHQLKSISGNLQRLIQHFKF